MCSLAHGVQAHDLRPCWKLHQQRVQVLGNGLWQPICSVKLRFLPSSQFLGEILEELKYILGLKGGPGARVGALTGHPVRMQEST